MSYTEVNGIRYAVTATQDSPLAPVVTAPAAPLIAQVVARRTNPAPWVGGNRVINPPTSDARNPRAGQSLGLDADALVPLLRRRSRLGLSVWKR